jgi:hypothetical protein
MARILLPLKNLLLTALLWILANQDAFTFESLLVQDWQNQFVVKAKHLQFPLVFNQEGYTGLVSIPNGNVLPDGTISLDFSNAMEPRFNDQYASSRNYALGIGFLPRLELAGRVAEFRDLETGVFQGTVDLSANIKIQLLREGVFLPAVSVGIQDLGGEASYFDSQYVVLSKTLVNTFRLTAGHGFSSTRLDGFFSGVEISPVAWLMTSLETDSDKAHAGATIFPLFFVKRDFSFLKQLHFKWVLADLAGERDVYGAVGIAMPLAEEKSAPIFTGDRMGDLAVAFTPQEREAKIKNDLVGFGFENIRVFQTNKVLAIAYENRMRVWDEMRALGKVLKVALENSDAQVSTFRVSILRQKIETLRWEVERVQLIDFIVGEMTDREFAQSSRIELLPQSKAWFPVDATNPSTLHSDLFLFPLEVHSIGTDLGSADLKLGLAPELRTPLWSGGLLRGSYQFHLVNTEPTALGLDYQNGIENLMIHQSFRLPFRILNQTSVGDYGDITGGHDPAVLNETIWVSEEGQVKVTALVGSSINNSYQLWLNRKIASLAAQYRFSPLDLAFTVEGGHYLYRDTGYVISLARSFGRADIGFQYLASERGTQGGVFLELPLTFSREPLKPWWVRPRLPDLFSSRLRTRLFNETNDINLRVANLPPMRYRLEDLYFDGDRLTPAYFRGHIGALREAILEE